MTSDPTGAAGSSDTPEGEAMDGMRDEATLEMSQEAMRAFGYRVVDALAEHMASLRDRPVVNAAERAETEVLFRAPPPERGEPLESVLRSFLDEVAPRITHVDHPRCFAFVPGAGSFVGAMADALASGYNIYGGTWVESSAPSQIELVVVDWFREWLGLPDTAGGTLVSGGSVANLTGLAVARDQRLAPEDRARAVLYTSELAHSSVDRAARLLGFRDDQVRKLAVDDRFRLDIDELRRAVAVDREVGRIPFCVIASAGATSTGTIDPLPAIAELCADERMWLHVDAAYGGFAVLDPRGGQLLDGLDRADSVSLDPHKWLYTPFEAGCVLVREVDRLFDTFHVVPDYLADLTTGPSEFNFCDHGIQLSRANRALKIWMSVRHFGLERYRVAIARTLDLAAHLEARIAALRGFEITSPASLGVVTFRYVPEGAVADEVAIEAANREIVRHVWASGRAMISSTRLRGRYVLRACVINHNSKRADVDALVDLLEALTAGSEIAPGAGR